MTIQKTFLFWSLKMWKLKAHFSRVPRVAPGIGFLEGTTPKIRKVSVSRCISYSYIDFAYSCPTNHPDPSPSKAFTDTLKTSLVPSQRVPGGCLSSPSTPSQLHHFPKILGFGS